MTKPETIRKAAERIRARRGTLDIPVNNAGVVVKGDGPLSVADPEASMSRIGKNRDKREPARSQGLLFEGALPSEVEAVAHLPVDLARIVVVEATEGEAVIQQHPGIGHAH